jgi:exonuclease SbcC
LEQKRSALASRRGELTSSSAEKEGVVKSFLRAGAEAGFAGDEARGLLKEVESRIASLNAATAAYDKKLETAKTVRTRIEAELEGAKNARDAAEKRLKEVDSAGGAGAEELEKRFLDLQGEQKRLEADLTRIEEKKSATTAEMNSLERSFKEWQGLKDEWQRSSAENTLLARLADDLLGNNLKRVPLDAWVLGMYLEDIIRHGSRRLEQVSGGRYTLVMNSEKTGGNSYRGLDIEVLDAYTGKQRSTASLSGGETFITAISLALALTDVVSERNGGITLESLFIDEGFGSLDPVTLDSALSVLDEIRGNRVIGIVSHVTELQDRIPARLEVIKESGGSRLEVLAN